MLIELGHFALALAFAFSIFQALVPLMGAFRGNKALMRSTDMGAYLIFGLTVFAFFTLEYAYAVSDFSVLNVYQNSFSEKPLIYKLTAIWGNHEGSMFLWVLILSLFSALVAWFGVNLPMRLKALILICQSWIGAAFLGFILFTSNPFLRITPAPAQGMDLNPVLQDIGLIIHPPLLYLGYVGFSVCFSFAVAALIDGRVDAAWARWVRPWTLVSWVFLTGGITVGSYWAYYELGWGGYWFWDPVENASLMPWLAGTALLHSAIVLEKRSALKVWTLFLALFTFALSLLGTFLVRSGILTSVHSFAVDPKRGAVILSILVFFVGASLLLFAVRASSLDKGGLFQLISREASLVFNNLFLTAATIAVLTGTLFPLIQEILTGDKITVGAPYFNLVFGVIMIPLLLVLPLGPLLAWKRGSLSRTFHWLWFSVLAALALFIFVLFDTSLTQILAAFGMGLAGYVILGALTDIWVKTGAAKTSLSIRFQRFCHLPRAVFGTVLAHLGIGLTLLGIVSVSTFEVEKVVFISLGETVNIGAYDVKFVGSRNVSAFNYSENQYDFALSRNGKPAGIITAAKRFFPVMSRITTEAGIASKGFSQVYIAPGDVRNDALAVHIWWKPRVLFIWLGGLAMMLGGFFSLSDRRLRIGAPKRAHSRSKQEA